MSQNNKRVRQGDEGLLPAVRQRTNLSVNKKTIGPPKKKSHSHGKEVPCHCPRHKGLTIRKDLWERCQENTRLEDLRLEIPAEILARRPSEPVFGGQNIIAGPSTLQPGPASSVPSYFSNEDAGLYAAQQEDDDIGGYDDDPTLPSFPTSLFDERTDLQDDRLSGTREDNWDANSESPALDDDQSSSSGWSMNADNEDVPGYSAEPVVVDENEGQDQGPNEPFEEPERPPTPTAPPELPNATLPSSPTGNEIHPNRTYKEKRAHIRFLEFYALYLHARCNLPKEHVETFLKTFGWATGPDGVLKPRDEEPGDEDGGERRDKDDDEEGNEGGNEGAFVETESTHVPLSQSLETLLKRFGIESNGERYAVCPNMSCNKLHLLSSLPCRMQVRCSHCKTDLMKLKHKSQGQTLFKPRLSYTHYSLIKQLERLLSRPEIIAAIRKHREHLRRPDRDRNVKEDIQHGNVWSELKGTDGKPFFTLDGDEIGLILTLDWFNTTTMVGARSHSTGVMAIAIANLPSELRWNPENLILIGTLPGPCETRCGNLTNYLEPLVAELLTLWHAPETRIDNCHVHMVKGALIMCICDSPAARKIAGTQAMTGTYFCTRCWCHKDEIQEVDKVHDRRTVAEHRAAAAKYTTLKSEAEKDKFLRTKATPTKPGGYRASCLLSLPYWDGARMVVVDPMHCFFLGLVKWQMKEIWIEFNHIREGAGLELSKLHDILESVSLNVRV